MAIYLIAQRTIETRCRIDESRKDPFKTAAADAHLAFLSVVYHWVFLSMAAAWKQKKGLQQSVNGTRGLRQWYWLGLSADLSVLGIFKVFINAPWLGVKALLRLQISDLLNLLEFVLSSLRILNQISARISTTANECRSGIFFSKFNITITWTQNLLC